MTIKQIVFSSNPMHHPKDHNDNGQEPSPFEVTDSATVSNACGGREEERGKGGVRGG